MASASPLSSSSPLLGFSQGFANTSISEIDNLLILSVAAPRNGMQLLNEKLNSLFALSWPETGQCALSTSTTLDASIQEISMLGLQADQCLLVLQTEPEHVHTLYSKVAGELHSAAYLTNQSDSYAVLDVKGENTLLALERICSLNMHTYNATSVTRTLMEHLQVIIQRPGTDHMRLYSPRSSAESFLHAVVTSVLNVTHDNATSDTAVV